MPRGPKSLPIQRKEIRNDKDRDEIIKEIISVMDQSYRHTHADIEEIEKRLDDAGL